MTTRNTEQRRYAVRGSFTVEASLVTSFIVIVLFLVLQMTFYLADTVRMEAVLAEESVRMLEDDTESGSWARNVGGFYHLSAGGVKTSSGKNTVSASVDQSVRVLPQSSSSVTCTYSRTEQDPVSFIRKVKMVWSLVDREE